MFGGGGADSTCFVSVVGAGAGSRLGARGAAAATAVVFSTGVSEGTGENAGGNAGRPLLLLLGSFILLVAMTTALF
jgi:hypothetical protein